MPTRAWFSCFRPSGRDCLHDSDTVARRVLGWCPEAFQRVPSLRFLYRRDGPSPARLDWLMIHASTDIPMSEDNVEVVARAATLRNVEPDAESVPGPAPLGGSSLHSLSSFVGTINGGASMRVQRLLEYRSQAQHDSRSCLTDSAGIGRPQSVQAPATHRQCYKPSQSAWRSIVIVS